jgi:ABC-type dipeptide/oligopeptide/nickel transport system permease subunit
VHIAAEISKLCAAGMDVMHVLPVLLLLLLLLTVLLQQLVLYAQASASASRPLLLGV